MGKTKKSVKLNDIYNSSEQLSHVDPADLMPLPKPLNGPASEWKPLKAEAREKYEATLDDTLLLNIPKPGSVQEEKELVRRFLVGVEKLFTKTNNWGFYQPLMATMEHCARCQTCSDACHIYEASGRNDIYRPTYRSETLRRIYYDYIKTNGKYHSTWKSGGDIPLNWKAVTRLAELAYRCNICRRCAQTCPIGADNALVAREIRKIMSQELNIYTSELHERGSMLQLKVGSSTGMNPEIVKDNIEFIDEDISEKTGMNLKTVWDKKGADILLIHNAGEIMAWPENIGAFNAIFTAAGLDWTMSSEALAYDNINYGLFYDDFQYARVVLKHAAVAKNLGVKRIVLGECGHATKALMVIADRVLTGDLNIPRESCFPLLRDLVKTKTLKLDPSRNNFPVTLHDPCNLVRLMGIVMPQREVVREICPQFREMTPHGVNNYCCGGGSGFAIHSGHNFEDWRFKISGRKKVSQILGAFQDSIEPETKKYVCAPCSNCKGQIRDLIAHYDLWNNAGITYGGLVELIVNAMVDVKPNYIDWNEIV
jgi:Fe-S oxidoreductase